MRRVLLITLLVLLFPAAADAASVKTVDCMPALDGAARGATFEAKMKAVKGTERRCRSASRSRSATTARRSWRRVSRRRLRHVAQLAGRCPPLHLRRTIQNLAAPAVYRTTVRFRWLDAEGDTLRTARDTSSWCRQPDLRPDLEVTAVDVLPGPRADRRRYTVTVRNDGRTDAGAVRPRRCGSARPSSGRCRSSASPPARAAA